MGALLLIGCAFEAGHGFGELEPVSFRAALTPGPARDLGGAVLTGEGYAVTLDAFVWTVGGMHLMELQGGGGGGGSTFDPADPPDGYSLCHGGHCHSDSGALVDYADIEAELAGGAASFAALVSLAPPGTLDMLSAAQASLAPDEPVLADVSLTKLRLESVGVHMSGTVRREPDDGFSATFDLDLALGGDLDAGLELPLGRGELPVIALSVALAPDGTLWDGLDFAALAVDGSIPTDAESDFTIALGPRLLAVEPAVTLTRTNWE